MLFIYGKCRILSKPKPQPWQCPAQGQQAGCGSEFSAGMDSCTLQLWCLALLLVCRAWEESDGLGLLSVRIKAT